MIEDKLSGGERLRLECLAQAHLTLGAAAGRVASSEKVLEIAERYERFIRGGDGDGTDSARP